MCRMLNEDGLPSNIQEGLIMSQSTAAVDLYIVNAHS